MKLCLLKSLLVVLLGATLGCSEKRADVDDNERYKRNGISFDYPGNWKVTEDTEIDGFRYLFVETPGDAIVKVEIYANKDSFSLLDFVHLDIESFNSEMKGIFKVGEKSEIAATKKTVGNNVFDGYEQKFDITILGVEVPHIKEFYLLKSDTVSAYIVYQVVTEDLGLVEGGFAQILGSFKVGKALKMQKP